MDKHELKDRTKNFALRVMKMSDALPHSRAGDVVARQIIRSATSTAANYRAALRGRSRADFTSKLGVVLEEADETLFWLEIIAESGLLSQRRIQSLMTEAEELVCIFTASLITTRGNSRKS